MKLFTIAFPQPPAGGKLGGQMPNLIRKKVTQQNLNSRKEYFYPKLQFFKDTQSLVPLVDRKPIKDDFSNPPLAVGKGGHKG